MVNYCRDKCLVSVPENHCSLNVVYLQFATLAILYHLHSSQNMSNPELSVLKESN